MSSTSSASRGSSATCSSARTTRDSKYWSFSVGREIGDFVAEIGYTGSRGGHGINQIHANPSVLTAAQAALVAATKNANAIPSVQARRVYPQYVPNRFVVHCLWEVPGPKSAFLKHVLGGWQVSGITAFQSGRPFTIWTGVDTNGDGTTGSDRPNLGSGTLDWDDGHRSFTNNGYVTVPLGTNNLPLANSLGDGTPGRNADRAASFWKTDLSLLKRFHIGQRQLIVRADAFNAFNQDSYGIPVVNMANSGFGTNTNNWGRRIITLSAKLIW